jgi:hypothetical protein
VLSGEPTGGGAGVLEEGSCGGVLEDCAGDADSTFEAGGEDVCRLEFWLAGDGTVEEVSLEDCTGVDIGMEDDTAVGVYGFDSWDVAVVAAGVEELEYTSDDIIDRELFGLFGFGDDDGELFEGPVVGRGVDEGTWAVTVLTYGYPVKSGAGSHLPSGPGGPLVRVAKTLLCDISATVTHSVEAWGVAGGVIVIVCVTTTVVVPLIVFNVELETFEELMALASLIFDVGLEVFE